MLRMSRERSNACQTAANTCTFLTPCAGPPCWRGAAPALGQRPRVAWQLCAQPFVRRRRSAVPTEQSVLRRRQAWKRRACTCGDHKSGLHHLELKGRRLRIFIICMRPERLLVAAELAHEPRTLRRASPQMTSVHAAEGYMRRPPNLTHFRRPRAAAAHPARCRLCFVRTPQLFVLARQEHGLSTFTMGSVMHDMQHNCHIRHGKRVVKLLDLKQLPRLPSAGPWQSQPQSQTLAAALGKCFEQETRQCRGGAACLAGLQPWRSHLQKLARAGAGRLEQQALLGCNDCPAAADTPGLEHFA